MPWQIPALHSAPPAGVFRVAFYLSGSLVYFKAITHRAEKRKTADYDGVYMTLSVVLEYVLELIRLCAFLPCVLRSPNLVPKPLDWGRNIDVVGFCFLSSNPKSDAGIPDYTPDKELADFLAAGEGN